MPDGEDEQGQHGEASQCERGKAEGRRHTQGHRKQGILSPQIVHNATPHGSSFRVALVTSAPWGAVRSPEKGICAWISYERAGSETRGKGYGIGTIVPLSTSPRAVSAAGANTSTW